MEQNSINNICIIGTGYVGLVAGACLADMGNRVICVDKDSAKINGLKKGIVPIFEPGLEELINSNTKENRLEFSFDIEESVQRSDVCFIAVGTPEKEDGSVELSYVYDAAVSIAKAMNGYKLIVNKSTVPVGTAEKIYDIINKNTKYSFDIVSNPEFLKQGNAVEDFLSPDRIIIGSNSEKALKIMQEIYAPFFRLGNRIITMDLKSAEMAKYAANAFLATKISFMNEIANLCEKVGADIECVRQGMSSDMRIGNKFLFSGIGFGGSCFPKDIQALINMGNKNGLDMHIISAVEKTNKLQKSLFIKKITDKYGLDLSGKTFAVWGLAFKPKTNDMRNAPSVTIIRELLQKGAKIQVYDPKAMETAKAYFSNQVIYKDNSYDALKNADALLLLTEWNEFRRPDFDRIKDSLKTPVIFDGRNQYNRNILEKKGFSYYSIGHI